jgi:nucleoside-diphosphate-sugar epimerase
MTQRAKATWNAVTGVPTRDLAAALGEHLGLPTASIAPEDAERHFGWIGAFYGLDLPATSARTRDLLGWVPTGPTLLTDIAAGAYPLPGVTATR